MSRDLDLSFLNTNKLLNTGDYDVDENKIIDKAEAIHSDTPIDENTFYGMKNGELGFHEVESGLSGDFVFTNPQDGEVISFDEGKWVNVELDISYSSLSDKPTLSTVATTGSYTDLLNVPNLSTVASSGSFLDLTNIPVEFTPSAHTHSHVDITGLGDIVTRNRGTQEGEVLVVGDIPNVLGTSTTLPATQKAIKDAIDVKVDDSPKDGELYARKDGAWVAIEKPDGVKVWVADSEWFDDPEEPEPEEGFITFSSDDPFSIKFNRKSWDGTLEYSTDTQNWTEWDGSEINSVDNNLYLRGTGNSKITGGQNPIQIDAVSGVACTGNIMTLLDHEDVDNAVMGVGAFAFAGMFYVCTSLTVAPELPATTLAASCYQSMFAGCTSLTTAPELPATTLAYQCYYSMFQGCTNLTVAPELTAMTLAENCYNNMFSGCVSLTVAPELPSTTLAEYCYNNMFWGCTSLTTAPELPATTLANQCYDSMFNGCTSLTTAPELPATTLAENCYNNMFRGCTSLVTAPELPATTLAYQCYADMFHGCTSLETAPELPSTTLAEYCYYDMFRGCTSLTTAPELPATTLATNCYRGMFRDCTSLTVAPELPATTLATHCYNSMFYNCTSIKISSTKTGIYQKDWRIPAVGTIGSSPSGWNTNMLANTGGTFKTNPEINTTYYQAG